MTSQDPDLRAAQGMTDAADDPEALATDELRPETETTEFEAPDAPSTPTRRRTTSADEARGETIDERRAQEEQEDDGT